jgi:hypothetical protein
MAVKFSNNASALLDGAITNSATSITLDDVSEFPTLSGADYTYLTLLNSAATTIEIIKVTAINTGTRVLTAVRAQDSTSASAFADGDTCELRLTTALLTDATADLSGEVTSTAGATVITDNIVDEANLKVSNAPTNGYVLTAQSGNAGGLTWAVAASGGTTNPILAFVASSGSIDNIEGNSYNTMPFYTAAGTIDVLPLNILTSGNTFPFYRADGTSDTIGVT